MKKVNIIWSFKYGRIKLKILDLLIIFVTFLISLYASHNGKVPVYSLHHFFLVIFFVMIFKVIVYKIVGLYNSLWEYVGIEEAIKIFSSVVITNVLIIVLLFLFNIEFLNSSGYIIATVFEGSLLTFPRFSKRIVKYYQLNIKGYKDYSNRTLIIGAGEGGKLVLEEIKRNPRINSIPIVFVDDSKDKIDKTLKGIKVVGPIDNVQEFISFYDIDEVIIAIADLDQEKLQRLVDKVSQSHVKVRRLPLMAELKYGEKRSIVDVKIEDLLERDVIDLDNDGIGEFIIGKKVMVTGAGGSIGSELCRQIITCEPEKLVLLDIYENNVYEVQLELQRFIEKNKLKAQIEVIIASVYNEQRLNSIVREQKPNIVFHAAAYKHVPLMENNSVEAVRTNVLGTYYLSKAASENNVEKFVLVSTDKAVRPTNTMGATKRFAEMIIQFFDRNSSTKFSAVRFGNVLGSNGSVVPIFKRQIEEGGPVTVTHPEITRFFMTIPEAVSLILQSGVYAEGGEIFILDMGEPVKIVDLAKKMIRLSGHKPHEDIKIEFTGLRPGEKMYEELLIDKEIQMKTKNDKIYIEKTNGIVNIEEKVDFIKEVFTDIPNDYVKELISEVVLTYTVKS